MVNTDQILLGMNGKAPGGVKGCDATDCSGDAQQLFGLLLGQMLGLGAPTAPQTPQQADQPPLPSGNAVPSAAKPVMLPDVEGNANQQEAAGEDGAAAAAGKQAALPLSESDGSGASVDELLGQALEKSLLEADVTGSTAAKVDTPELAARSLQPGAAPSTADHSGHFMLTGAAPTQQSGPSPFPQASTPLPAAQPPAEAGPKFADTVVHASVEGNKLAVTIEPKGLGAMDINLSLDRGVVHAQVQVAQDNARQLIESNLQQLLDTLAREGISLGGFNISLKNQDGSWRQSLNEGRDRKGTDSEGAAAPVAGTGHAEPGRLSIYA